MIQDRTSVFPNVCCYFGDIEDCTEKAKLNYLSDEGLMLETSAPESLYGGHFSLSTYPHYQPSYQSYQNQINL